MIIICKLLSSHLDKCIITLGHFSTTNISPGGKKEQGQGHRVEAAFAPPPLAPPMRMMSVRPHTPVLCQKG